MEPNQPGQKSGSGMTVAIVIIIILVIAVVAWKMMAGKTDTTTPASVANTETQVQPDQQATSTTNVTASTTTTVNVPKTVTVTLTDTGYSPKSVTINSGDTVKFVNDSKGRMWTASNPHPAHTDYPGFDEKSGAVNGGSYEFMFEKVGTWGYHNHLNPSLKGTVVVK
jgi:plastocyanin